MAPTSNYSHKLYISTNSTCNLNCMYCFEHEKDKFEFDVNNALEIIKEQLKTKTVYGTQISLRGGEPFMVFSKIRELCEKVWSLDISEYYHFHITTNGTLIHGEIQDWLYAHRDKITLKLSLDGNKNSSDINRPKSFDLIDFRFLLETWPNIKVNMTITAATLPFLSKNIKFIHSLGFQYITPHFSIMTDWEHANLERTLYEQLIDVSDYYLNNPTLNPCGFFQKDLSSTLLEKDFHLACNDGSMKAYDMQTKKYYPCYMCFPSVGGETLAKELEQLNFNDLGQICDPICQNCSFLNLCVTCYAENYISRGALSHRDMSLCKYQKVVFAALFYFEYKRLLNLTDPTPNDVQKMKAIQKHHPEIENIVQNLI